MEGIIDFEKLENIVPEEGSLTLKFSRKNGELSVLYAPQYKGKEELKELSPLILRGKPGELAEAFAQLVTGVYPFEKMAATAGQKLKERKEALEKTLNKGGKKAQGKDDDSLFVKKEKKKAAPAEPETKPEEKPETQEGGEENVD
jgi:PRTRC genetic system protein E